MIVRNSVQNNNEKDSLIILHGNDDGTYNGLSLTPISVPPNIFDAIQILEFYVQNFAL